MCKNLKDIYEKQRLEAAKEKREEENSAYIKTEIILLLSGERKLDDINTGHSGTESPLGIKEAWGWPT